MINDEMLFNSSVHGYTETAVVCYLKKSLCLTKIIAFHDDLTILIFVLFALALSRVMTAHPIIKITFHFSYFSQIPILLI